MKIIDLLNKIANDEEVPKKIKYLDAIFTYINETKQYYKDNCETILTKSLRACLTSFDRLNDEVEIVEYGLKKINSLNTFGNFDRLENIKDKQNLNNQILKNKINELIDEISNLKRGDE